MSEPIAEVPRERLAVALGTAMVCVGCELVHEPPQVCPRCGSAHSHPLAAWLDRPKPAVPAHASDEAEAAADHALALAYLSNCDPGDEA